MPDICLEILVLTQWGGRLRYVELDGDGWGVAWQGGDPGAEALAARGAQCHRLGGAFAGDSAVLHSTSWRFDANLRQMVITFLAVIPDGSALKSLVEAGVARSNPVTPAVAATAVLTGGDGVHPAPEAITGWSVRMHAIEHLAFLRQRDPAVAALVCANRGWRELDSLLAPFEQVTFRAAPSQPEQEGAIP